MFLISFFPGKDLVHISQLAPYGSIYEPQLDHTSCVNRWAKIALLEKETTRFIALVPTLDLSSSD